MSIESEISRIKNGVSDAYDAVEELGGDLPDEKTVDNLSDSIATISGSGSNGNMIINWDFRKPVNRNGKTSYTISTSSVDNYESSIDRWAISGTGSLVVADDSIIIARIGNLILKQVFDNQQSLAGYDVTVSFLVSGNVKIVLKIDDAYPKAVYYNDESVGIATFTHTFPDEFSRFWLMIQPQSDDPVTLYGCKMEIGAKQTLAKQDENGDWKIIDPPDYDLQYALCCQYSQIDGSFVGNGNKLSGKHDNLLDNACFLYPVNRNGKTSYTSGTTIDRWLAYTYGSATVNVDLTTDGLTIIRSGTGYSGIAQTIVNADWWNTSIAGNTVTTSLLLSDGTLRSNSYIVPTIPTTKFISLCAFPNGAVYLYGERIVVILTSGTSITIKAVKMELGSAQTLAERSNGVWNLIDIPTYSQEYLRTTVFSTNTSEFSGLRIPGQNILRNWDFRNPVNRNGKTIYSKNGGTIDGWTFVIPGGVICSVELLDYGIKFTKDTGSFCYIYHRVQRGILTFLDGKIITGSILLSDGTLITGSIVYSKASTNWNYVCRIDNDDLSLGMQTNPNTGFHIVINKGSCIIQAVKLEVGGTQTLARQNSSGVWELIDLPDYTAQYALCSLYNLETGEFVEPLDRNPNLLINWDLRKPVNRNGMTEYVVSDKKTRYTIDGYQTDLSLYILQDYIEIRNNVLTNSAWWVKYYVDKSYLQNNIGRILTFSALICSSTAVNNIYIKFGTTIMTTPTPVTSDFTLFTFTFTLSDVVDNPFWGFVSHSGLTGNETFRIKAVKLELGSIQTLARKNNSGEWEIIDPTNYDFQYLLTSQYSPVNGAYVGIQHSNSNLLDNWYLVDPINQRGQTTYPSAYGTIDRWLSYNAEVHIDSGYINVTGISDGTIFIAQKFEDFKQMYGKTYTTSVLVRGNSSGFRLGLYSSKATYASNMIQVASDDWALFSFTVTLPDYSDETHLGFIIYSDTSATGSIDIQAAKLELGPIQTLAHREGDNWVLNDPPPNKALELAKCQRYLQVYERGRAGIVEFQEVQASNDGQAIFSFTLPQAMRANPSVVIGDALQLRAIDSGSGLSNNTAFALQWGNQSSIRIFATDANIKRGGHYACGTFYDGKPFIISAEL